MFARPLPRAMFALLALGAASLLGGCVTFQPLEPILSPPSNFQLDTVTKVEFIAPTLVGLRCAERGAKFLGLPGINSGACSDETLMTMPNPCLTFTGGPYAGYICRELESLGSWEQAAGAESEAGSNAQPDSNTANRNSMQPTRIAFKTAKAASATAKPKPLSYTPIEFVKPEQLTFRCAERGAKMTRDPEGNWGACSDGILLTVANPCYVEFDGWFARMLCHEMGHANGWSANHSGGTMQRQMPIRPLSEAPPLPVVLAKRPTPQDAVVVSLPAPAEHIDHVVAPAIRAEAIDAPMVEAAVAPSAAIPEDLQREVITSKLIAITAELFTHVRRMVKDADGDLLAGAWAKTALEMR